MLRPSALFAHFVRFLGCKGLASIADSFRNRLAIFRSQFNSNSPYGRINFDYIGAIVIAIHYYLGRQ